MSGKGFGFLFEMGCGQVTATTVLTRLLRLQQFTGGFLVEDEATKPQLVSRGKLDALADILHDYVLKGRKKLVIFARFIPEVMEIIKLTGDMLDMGSTVEEIAEKSGFSQTTVRRRVKMMELDQEKLREVSKRQLSLTDFDKLAQIEDIKVRNQCLDKMGTHDFNQSVTWELKRQATKKKLPAARKLLKKLGAKELQNSETWGSAYDSISGYIYLADWEENTPLLDKKYSGQLFYTLDKDSGSLRFFEKHKRAAPEKKSPEQQVREKRIADAWAVIHEQAAVAYQLRSDFVKGLHYTQKNANLILKGALTYGVLDATVYSHSNGEAIKKLLGVDPNYYAQDRAAKQMSAFHAAAPEIYPALIYGLFSDGPKEFYSGSYEKIFPEHSHSVKLDSLYSWLTSLGYEMSDEEKAMQDGSHEVFRKEAQS